MDTDERLKLRAKAQALPSKMNIGKSGITAGVVEEVSRQLEEHRLLKVRLLPSAQEEKSREELAQDLAVRAGAELVEVRGNTAVLWRRGKRKAAPKPGAEAGQTSSRRPPGTPRAPRPRGRGEKS